MPDLRGFCGLTVMLGEVGGVGARVAEPQVQLFLRDLSSTLQTPAVHATGS